MPWPPSIWKGALLRVPLEATALEDAGWEKWSVRCDTGPGGATGGRRARANQEETGAP